MSELDERIIAAVAGGQTAVHRVRHAKQDAEIVRQMIGHGLLTWKGRNGSNISADNVKASSVSRNSSRDDSDTAYVELGAGERMIIFLPVPVAITIHE
jgi:hypothetical protein